MSAPIATYHHSALWGARVRVLLWSAMLVGIVAFPIGCFIAPIGLIGLMIDFPRAFRGEETFEVLPAGFVITRGGQRIQHGWFEAKVRLINKADRSEGVDNIEGDVGEDGCLGCAFLLIFTGGFALLWALISPLFFRLSESKHLVIRVGTQRYQLYQTYQNFQHMVETVERVKGIEPSK